MLLQKLATYFGYNYKLKVKKKPLPKNHVCSYNLNPRIENKLDVVHSFLEHLLQTKTKNQLTSFAVIIKVMYMFIKQSQK